MEGIFLLLGTNLGEREKNISDAKKQIKKAIGSIIDSSSIYETASWGVENEPDYLNQVIKIETKYSPKELLSHINTIEKNLGRIRFEKWHSRIIDIDILYYNNEIINTNSLNIPHPEINNRLFTLIPLNEIAGNEMVPGLNVLVKDLIPICSDSLDVKIFNTQKKESV